MNKSVDVRNPYELPRVVLAPIADEIQLDENLEPPFIRVRDTNSQYIQLDTSLHSAYQNPAQSVITINRAMPRVNRIQMAFFAYRSYTPNINPRNNVFTFIQSGVPYIAVIPADVNYVGLARYQQLAIAMSSAVGVVGEYMAVGDPNIPNAWILSNTNGHTFRFEYIGSGITRGRFLWGFNERNYSVGTEALLHVLVSYTESYSRYLDISSFELTQYTKIDTAGTNVPAEVLFRYFLTDVTFGQSTFTGFTQSPSLNYDRSRSISSVDIDILDEFGETFYIPELAWGSSVFYIVLIASM